MICFWFGGIVVSMRNLPLSIHISPSIFIALPIMFIDMVVRWW